MTKASRGVLPLVLAGVLVTTPAAVRDEIEKTSGFVGLDGTFTFSPTDHNGLTSNDLVMYTITGGKWVLAK